MSQLYTICAFTENSPGVLHRLTVIFTRRGINIESLTVSETERKGVSRFTIVVESDKDQMKKLVQQIRRIVECRDVFASPNQDLLFTEVCFIRVDATALERKSEIEEVTRRNGASVVRTDPDSFVIERTGTEDEINALYVLLEPYGIREFVRSGRIALLSAEKAEIRA